MKPKWKRVGTHGQPPERALVRKTIGDFSTSHTSPSGKWNDDVQWLTAEEAATLLPAPDDIEPAPLPEPWQPMDERPNGGLVLIADANGNTFVWPARAVLEKHRAIAWAPLPEHPGGAS